MGDGQRLYWEACGNPAGKPAVVLHGGPGSGATPVWRRFFDPTTYRAVLFDQRGCGRSTPNAADPTVDLSVNTTGHLVADIERLREHLKIDRWLVFGGSWGATLAQAYTRAHPERVSEVVLFSVTTTSRREVDWVTHAMRRLIPEAWERFRAAAQPRPAERIVDAYARRLADPDLQVRDAAAWAWCAWEDDHVAIGQPDSARPSTRYEDPVFRACFARLVTHYWRHAAFLPDGALLAAAHGFGHIPAVFVHGQRDISGPPDIAYDLAQAWPGSRLVLVDDAAHGVDHGDIAAHLVAATIRLAS
ncbi:proline iminopeptidase [Pseudonocardia parietis]|uniref:Proline iminopeptidase n=1 Tax=Pseudonocardia parietis TaxID=570936 RepID=A0ABS4W567_9PSEU|nr:proline iminopeptidase [Pseudonocardia parietis]